jgi:hypothetical protein
MFLLMARSVGTHNVAVGNRPATADLTRHGVGVSSVFDILGKDENDLTAALGFVLAHCPMVRAAALERRWPEGRGLAQQHVSFALEVRDRDGRTDLEIQLGRALLIVEAKRGWVLPKQDQLGRYAHRIAKEVGPGALVTLSQASQALAAMDLPDEISGVPVRHLAWRDVFADISAVRGSCRGRERLWLDEFRAYLKGVVRVRQVEDSWTYCVAVNDKMPDDGGSFTFREYVTEDNRYFHPFVIAGWPTEFPNFLAFRWDNAVQRIHRVEHAEVVPSLRVKYPKLRKSPGCERPHVVYDLGPRLPPLKPIPNGTNYRAARLWVILDQLQTGPTLKDALAGTRALKSS